MWTAVKGSKCCATCAHWGGPRKVTYAKNSETDSPSTRGKCYENVFCGVTQGPTADGGRQCTKYQPWSAMK